MARSILRYIAVVLCGLASLQGLASQTASAQSEGVTVSYELPERVTLHEPVSLAVVVDNQSTEDATIDLGASKVGNTQITLTAPDGSQVTIDPRRPSEMFRTKGPGLVRLQPRDRVRTELVLNEWASLDFIGKYRLVVRFIGTISPPSAAGGNQQPVDLTLEVLPRNVRRLREVADLLVRQTQTIYAERADLAAKKLLFLNDPVVVPFLLRVIDERKGHWVDPIMISALERVGTDEARDALLKAGGNSNVATSRSAWAAIERLDRKRQDGGR